MFKTIIALLLLGLSVQVMPRQDFHKPPVCLAPLPDLDLDLATFIDIIGEYDVIHEGRMLHPVFNYYGMTVPDLRTIFLDSTQDRASMNDTVIHEVFHIAYGRKGIRTDGPMEPCVEDKAQELYQKLYGRHEQ